MLGRWLILFFFCEAFILAKVFGLKVGALANIAVLRGCTFGLSLLGKRRIVGKAAAEASDKWAIMSDLRLVAR